MPPDEWKKCGDSKLQLADFAGEKCWIGMDLAEKRDFAALALVFQRGDRFFLFVRLYLNELAVAESGNAHLQGWAHAGYVTVTDGNATDFDVIADDLRNYCQRSTCRRSLRPGAQPLLRDQAGRRRAFRWSRSARRRCSSPSRSSRSRTWCSSASWSTTTTR
jgi:hypothetical protein